MAADALPISGSRDGCVDLAGDDLVCVAERLGVSSLLVCRIGSDYSGSLPLRGHRVASWSHGTTGSSMDSAPQPEGKE